MKYFFSDEVYIFLFFLFGMEGRCEFIVRVEVNCLLGLLFVESVEYLFSKVKK